MMGDAVQSTVAIVGDDAGTRDSVAMLLETHGFQVRQYVDARSCLADAAGLRRLGCLLLDLSEPGMSGLEVLERLAGEGEVPPSILIVAEVTVPLIARARAAGARLVLARPVPPLELVADVRGLTG